MINKSKKVIMTTEEREKMDIAFIEMAKRDPELQEPLFCDSRGINRFNEYYRMRFDNDIHTEYEPFSEWLDMTEKIEKSEGVTVTPELYKQYEEFVAEHKRLDSKRAWRENGDVCGRPLVHIPAPSFIDWMMMKKENEKMKESVSSEIKDQKKEYETPVILSNALKKDVNITISGLKKKTR